MNESTAQKTAQKWNLRVYLAGDNSLGEEVVWSLTEMMKACPVVPVLKNGEKPAPNPSVHIQFDLPGIPQRYLDFDAPPSRGLQNGKGLDLYVKPRYCLGKEGNSASARVFARFLRHAIKADGANLLVLSGHGSGSLGDFLPDSNPQGAMSIPLLAKKLRDHIETKKMDPIEIIGMDSCLMSMVEVGFELRECGRFLVGSEGFVLNAGWPYANIIGYLQQNPKVEAEQLATELVRIYSDYYSEYDIAGISTDQAACRLDRMESLAEALRTLVENLMKVLDNPHLPQQRFDDSTDLLIEALIAAHWRAQSYKNEQYVDLYDFVSLLRDACERNSKLAGLHERGIRALSRLRTGVGWASLRRYCDRVLDEIRKVVVVSRFRGAAVQHSHGLSVYFPWYSTPTLDLYENLKFARKSSWHGFLRKYLEVTRRQPLCWDCKEKERKQRCYLPTRDVAFSFRGSDSAGRFAPWQTRFAPWQTKFAPWQTKFPPESTRLMQSGGLTFFIESSGMKNPALKFLEIPCDPAKMAACEKLKNEKRNVKA